VASGAERVRGCAVSQIQVLGLADAVGSRTRNLALSRRRAAEVGDALKALGLPAPMFDIEAMGEAGAKTVGGEPEVMRRRAEVVIHAAPRRP
jgi:peptidoglycan-associated lipoprotein